MSRRLCTTLPLTTNQLQPRVVQHFIISNRDKQYKQKQKENFDRRHGARPLNTLCQNDPVWMVDRKEEGFIKRKVIYDSIIEWSNIQQEQIPPKANTGTDNKPTRGRSSRDRNISNV